MGIPCPDALFAISPNVDYIILYKFVIILSYLLLLSEKQHATIFYILREREFRLSESAQPEHETIWF